jgi:hypothetical protein
MHRRDFMKAMVAAAPFALLQPAPTPEARICLFTDHLAGFDYQEVATMLRLVARQRQPASKTVWRLRPAICNF